MFWPPVDIEKEAYSFLAKFATLLSLFKAAQKGLVYPSPTLDILLDRPCSALILLFQGIKLEFANFSRIWERYKHIWDGDRNKEMRAGAALMEM